MQRDPPMRSLVANLQILQESQVCVFGGTFTYVYMIVLRYLTMHMHIQGSANSAKYKVIRAQNLSRFCWGKRFASSIRGGNDNSRF